MIVISADVNNVQSKDFKLHRPNGREDYLFVLFKSPSFVMTEGSYSSVDSGDCIIFDKYKIQSYFPNGQEFLHDFIHFNTESRAEEMLIHTLPLGNPFKLSAPERITSILSAIIEERNHVDSKYNKNILDNLAIAFIYLLKSDVEREHIGDLGKHYADMVAIRNDIYHSPEKNRTVEEACKSVYLSRSHFQHLYKRYFGISFVEDVINARIDFAKKLLLTGSLSISDIAERCGYKSSSHFIRQFGNEVGMSPDKFKNK